MTTAIHRGLPFRTLAVFGILDAVGTRAVVIVVVLPLEVVTRKGARYQVLGTDCEKHPMKVRVLKLPLESTSLIVEQRSPVWLRRVSWPGDLGHRGDESKAAHTRERRNRQAQLPCCRRGSPCW